MPRLLHRYATPLITGLVLVSLVSGLGLFLGIGRSLFHQMHEILGLSLIVPFGLHLWRNWRSMMGYMRHAPIAVALGLSAAAALAFALPAATEGGAGGPPQFALAHTLVGHTPSEVAPALGTTPEDLLARLSESGFAIGGPDQPLAEIAATSGKTEFELLAALLPAS